MRLQLLLAACQSPLARPGRDRAEVAGPHARHGGGAHRSPLDDARATPLPSAPAALGAPQAPRPAAQSIPLGAGLMSHASVGCYRRQQEAEEQGEIVEQV